MPLNPEDPPSNVERFYERIKRIISNETDREMVWNELRNEALHRFGDQDDRFKGDFKREHPERLHFEEILEQLVGEWEAGTWPPRS